MRETVALHNEGEEEKHLGEIEKAAHLALPNVPTNTVAKMIKRARELSIHCAQERGP